MTMRKAATEAAYTQAKLGGLRGLLVEPATKEWTAWKLLPNGFPHDKLATHNDLLVLKRESAIVDILPEEFAELFAIVTELEHDYDCLLFNFPSMRSVSNIPHIHLYKLKPGFRD